ITLSFFHGPESRLERLCSAFGLDIFGVQHLERRINDGKTDNLTCPYIDLPPDFSAYLATLSANARQKLRRLLRQLDEDADLKVTRSRPETYHQDASILAELWFLQYAEQKGPKRAARLKAQFKEVITVGLANGIIHLVVLWRGGKPIAAQANYIDLVKRQALFHVGGRDDTVRDLASGLLLHAHCIRWSIANGLTRYDFTLGDEPYKYSFGVSDRRISCVEIFTKSGENATGRLDETCRDDVAELIRRYAARGRSADARTAAQQALAVWPDFASTVDVEALISKASG
ncbi:MAG: GNAT family N-acetyltransferase, partial [Pseudomonadota bacterium]